MIPNWSNSNSNDSNVINNWYFLYPTFIYNRIWSLFSSPSIAQLVERRTVVEVADILRSLVRIRFEGLFCLSFSYLFSSVWGFENRVGTFLSLYHFYHGMKCFFFLSKFAKVLWVQKQFCVFEESCLKQNVHYISFVKSLKS